MIQTTYPSYRYHTPQPQYLKFKPSNPPSPPPYTKSPFLQPHHHHQHPHPTSQHPPPPNPTPPTTTPPQPRQPSLNPNPPHPQSRNEHQNPNHSTTPPIRTRRHLHPTIPPNQNPRNRCPD